MRKTGILALFIIAMLVFVGCARRASEVTSIAFETSRPDTFHEIGTNPDLSGTVIRVAYTDGSSELLSIENPNITVDGVFDGYRLDTRESGQQTLTIMFEGVSLTVVYFVYNIKVTEKIQDAIDSASSGDYIFVDAGVYEEELEIDKSITLLGRQAGVVATSRSNDNTANESIIEGKINISADGTVLNGLYLSSVGGDRYTLEGTTNVKFLNNKIGYSHTASVDLIVIRNTTNFLFENNWVFHVSPINTVNMLKLEGENDGLKILNNKFEDGTFETDSTIRGASAIIGTGDKKLTNFEISNNDFSFLARNPIQLVSSDGIENGRISDNKFSFYGFGNTTGTYQGISIGFSVVAEVNNLEISNNVFSNTDGMGITFAKIQNINGLRIKDNSFINIGSERNVWPARISGYQGPPMGGFGIYISNSGLNKSGVWNDFVISNNSFMSVERVLVAWDYGGHFTDENSLNITLVANVFEDIVISEYWLANAFSNPGNVVIEN